MTTVTFYRENDLTTGFTCFGHADYAKKRLFKREPDILCAGISALVLHTINALEELAKEDISVETNEETGYIRCDFPNGLQEKSIFLVDALIYSLQKLSEEYGETYLQVNIKEV